MSQNGSVAGPGAASGRRQPSRDCSCLADGADPCRRRARPQPRSGNFGSLQRFSSTVWVFFRVELEGRLVRHILVWDVISLSVAFPALSDAFELPGPGRASTEKLKRLCKSPKLIKYFRRFEECQFFCRFVVAPNPSGPCGAWCWSSRLL